jgi:SAM-dependent methyltransferase
MTEKPFTYPDQDYNTHSAEQVLPLLISTYHPGSVLDVGCGNGTWLLAAEKLGISDLMGIDVQEQMPGSWLLEKEIFRLVNLQEPFELNRKFDMILCLEVAEHLSNTSASVFIESLINHADLIVFSAAIPGQGGDRHINEKEPSYWQDLFNKRGYNTYDELRPRIWENDKVLWWYRQNIFIAERKSVSKGRNSEDIPYLVHPDHYQEKEEKMAALENNMLTEKQKKRSFFFHLKQAGKSIFQRKDV